ncbi:MAG: hypothetical protein MIO92_15315 [Methanosarcinaceae archaeon]|nr:hypothetical protein [Methanosarcinaceae archaeon]
MSFLVKLLLPIAIRIVASTVRKMSPEIRKEFVDFVLVWEKKCKVTDNKIDDILVMAVKGILDIK